MKGKKIKIKAKRVKFSPLKARSATYPRRLRHLLTSRAEARKRKKALSLQTVVMASSRLMNSFPVRTQKVRDMRRRRRRRKRRKYQSQTTKKTNYPHPLKTNPQTSPCQSRAHLRALRRPAKGP